MPVHQQMALAPLLPPPRPVGLGGGWVGLKGLPRQRRFERGPVDALPSPSDPFHMVILVGPGLPHGLEHSGALPLEESLVNCAGTAKALFGRSLRLAPGAQHVHDCLEDLPRRLRWSSCTRLSQVLFACSAPTHWDQRFDALPEIVGHNPRINSLARCHVFARPPRELQLGMTVHCLRMSSQVKTWSDRR
jgi:hypothetical protein